MKWHKIFQILTHELWVRIRTRWFWVSTIATPFFFFLVFYPPVYFTKEMSERPLTIYFVTEDTAFFRFLKPHPLWTYRTLPIIPLDSLKTFLRTHENSVGVILPSTFTKKTLTATLYTSVSLSIGEETFLQKSLEKALEKTRLVNIGIDLQLLENASLQLDTQVIKVSEEGEKQTSGKAAAIVGYFSVFLMYIFLVFYGNMLMQGVSQEKQNRVVEILLTSVRPIELMFGKIIGIGLVGLFQYLVLGILLLLSLFLFLPLLIPKEVIINPDTNAEVEKGVQMIQALQEIITPSFILLFLLCFLLGYLLYASFYAMIGSIVERDADAGQFSFIILLPLLISMFSITLLLTDPYSPFIVFLSYFPLTAPVIVPARYVIIDLHWYEIPLSLFFLVTALYMSIWLSSRVYRAAILLYGQKPSWKLIWKLLKIHA
jgi:ABC-2 type transport system permease protein